VNPALVDINVSFGYQQTSGAGTGIVLTSNGEILTNNHVIEGATSIRVTDIGNGKTYSATVVGYDATDDVAVIQLQNASGLQTAKIGDSSKVSVGDAVVAIGNAGGAGGTPTAAGGSVTGLNQSITAADELTGKAENLTGLIETNADIQSGDSGGSLVNSSGQVIGMDTAGSQSYALSSQTSQGYAVPINKALSIVHQIESGTSTSSVHVGPTAFLGLLTSSSGSPGGSPFSGGSYSPFGNQGSGSSVSGAVVAGVVNGSAAQQAGLSQGDVITSLDGHTINSASDITAVVSSHKPGDRVQIGWTDTAGQTHTATVTLGSGPAQ
jgi:S1-C subfamily serine protease